MRKTLLRSKDDLFAAFAFARFEAKLVNGVWTSPMSYFGESNWKERVQEDVDKFSFIQYPCLLVYFIDEEWDDGKMRGEPVYLKDLQGIIS